MDLEKEENWLSALKTYTRGVHFVGALGEETLLAAIAYLRQEPRRGFKLVLNTSAIVLCLLLKLVVSRTVE